jgi:hypothetical protein
MKVRKDGIGLNSSRFPVLVREQAKHQTFDQRQTVGVAPVVLGLAPTPTGKMLLLRNTSAAGQSIRVGIAPLFGAFASGMLLYPGDAYSVDNVTGLPQLSAVADAAGGLLEISSWET